MTDLDIAEVARRTGVPVSTLRYYEERGLIASTGRRGRRRQYDPGVLERLGLIALGRSAGFSIEQMTRMFPPLGQPDIDRRVLVDRADEIDRTIRELAAVRDSLRHAAACPAPSHLDCPTFRRLVRRAAAGTTRTASRPPLPRRRRAAEAG